MKTNKLYTGLTGLALAFGMVSCSDVDSIPEVSPAYCAEKIVMDIPENLQQYIYTDNTGATVLPLLKGEKVSLNCTLYPEDITFKEVVWSSSLPSVATVDNGTVEAISGHGLGYSVISVTPKGMYPGSGVNSTLKVKVDEVLIPASSISLTATTTEVYEGETIQLQATIAPSAATYQTVKWTSSDPSMATVDHQGNVTGVKVAGNGSTSTVTITATALDNSGQSASQEITVKRIVAPQSVTISNEFATPNYVCAIADKKVSLAYTTYPEDCTTSLIEWTSSDESIAIVENGVVTFNQMGNFGDFTITATCPATGNSSSIRMSLPAGLIRELFRNPENHTWGAGSNATVDYFDGYAKVTTSAQNATNQRGDFKALVNPYICPANYPIFAIKIEDVKDKYEACTFRAFKFDMVGDDTTDGTTFAGELGNGSDRYLYDFKIADGSHVYVYDFSQQGIGGSGAMIAAGHTVNFRTFQIKYADMRTLESPITYNVYWVQTFKTLDDVKDYIDSEGIEYERIK